MTADANLSWERVEIRVLKGLYTPDTNSAVPYGKADREATFQLDSNGTIKGGYTGLDADVNDANSCGGGICSYKGVLPAIYSMLSSNGIPMTAWLPASIGHNSSLAHITWTGRSCWKQ